MSKSILKNEYSELEQKLKMNKGNCLVLYQTRALFWGTHYNDLKYSVIDLITMYAFRLGVPQL